MKEDVEYIIGLLGNKNEELEDNEADEISEEISTLEDEIIYELTLIIIGLGKWQLLDCILNSNEFTLDQVNDFKDALEDYVNNDDQDDEDDEDIRHDIGSKMEIIIVDTETNPVNWMKSVKKSKIFGK